MKSDLVDLKMKLHHMTEKAILVSLDDNEKETIWLPLELVEYIFTDKKKGIVEVSIPQWLAYKKGLI